MPRRVHVLEFVGDARVMSRVFAVYALCLFVATHWPNLAIPLPGRPDLVVHLSIFGAWTVLLFLSGVFGERTTWRAVALTQLVAVCYAAADEALQAIPVIRRHFDWDDMMFNVFGVVIGTMVCAWLRAILDARPRTIR